MRNITLAFGLVMLLSACVSDQALIKPTSSGYAEGVFKNETLDSVKNKLIGACSKGGAMIEEVSDNLVVCSKVMDGTKALFAQALIGNSSSTRPIGKIRFVMYSENSVVNVTADQWIETQMALGQVRRVELNSHASQNALQTILDKLGAN